MFSHLLSSAVAESSGAWRFTKFETIMTILGVIVAGISSVLVGLRWIWHQGAANNAQITATNNNTKATVDLTVAFNKFAEKTADQIDSLEHRLTVLEVQNNERYQSERNPADTSKHSHV